MDYPSPLCMFCKHLSDAGFVCDAFPEGIPDEIIHSNFDHRQPHKDDQGIQFEAKSRRYAGIVKDIFQDIFP